MTLDTVVMYDVNYFIFQEIGVNRKKNIEVTRSPATVAYFCIPYARLLW